MNPVEKSDPQFDNVTYKSMDPPRIELGTVQPAYAKFSGVFIVPS